jgi:hypothetical protein
MLDKEPEYQDSEVLDSLLAGTITLDLFKELDVAPVLTARRDLKSMRGLLKVALKRE